LLLYTSSVIRDQYFQQREKAREELQQRVIEVEIARDEAQQARQQAEKSYKIKSAFLASMSHELRTPLNAILNFTQFVKDGDLGQVNAQQVETLAQVITSGRHLLSLINDVLDMSKIEAGSLRLFIEEQVELNDIAQEVAGVGLGLLHDKPVQMLCDIPDDLPTVRGDRQRLLQILLNILSNACKFTERGTITLKLWARGGDEVWLSVQDTGVGIAPEDQAGVFEAFKQTASGLRQGGGTGLGMPISKSLVEAHGGRIWLESAVGQGTTFFVVLPTKSFQ
jgi:signal transduction histidine kinase